jgi:MoaA/NifB/PqqE/SkfB family radical SAM enzyme
MNQIMAHRVYRFTRLPELADLKIEVGTRGERLWTRTSGTSSLWLRFIINRYFSFHSSLGTLGKRNGGNVYSMYLPPIPSPAHERMFESFLSTIVLKRRIPMAATIAVTSDCQYRCVHCSALRRPANRSVMTLEEIQRVVRECLDLGVTNLTFTGGEPLLRKDLEQMVGSVPQDMGVTQVFTNAVALSPERVESLVQAGVYGVQISLDSPDPAEHNRLRGSSGAFTAVERGVAEARRAGLLVGLATYATRDRVRDHFLLRIAELAAGWGVQEISVFDAIETGGLRGQCGLVMDRMARKQLMADMKTVNRRYRNTLRAVTQTWTNSGHGFSRFIGCLAANFQIHITAQGDFTPCDFTPLSFGNIREASVQALWTNLLSHPEYRLRKLRCRMQDPVFRRRYIEPIPEGADLPYRITSLQ